MSFQIFYIISEPANNTNNIVYYENKIYNKQFSNPIVVFYKKIF